MRGVRLITGLTGLFLFVASSAPGQASAKEEFEVAAVKPFTPNPSGWTVRTEGGPGTSDPTRIRDQVHQFKLQEPSGDRRWGGVLGDFRSRLARFGTVHHRGDDSAGRHEEAGQSNAPKLAVGPFQDDPSS